MSVEELSGRPPDPDCLHCVVAPVVAEFVGAHPEKPHLHVIGELAQTIGELIAAGVFNAGATLDVRTFLDFATVEMEAAADLMVQTLRSRKRQ